MRETLWRLGLEEPVRRPLACAMGGGDDLRSGDRSGHKTCHSSGTPRRDHRLHRGGGALVPGTGCAGDCRSSTGCSSRRLSSRGATRRVVQR